MNFSHVKSLTDFTGKLVKNGIQIDLKSSSRKIVQNFYHSHDNFKLGIGLIMTKSSHTFTFHSFELLILAWKGLKKF